MLRFFLPLVLAGCTAVPAETPNHIVFEVQPVRDCPSLPTLSDNATTSERTAFTRRVVGMYAQCAKGSQCN